VLGPAPGRSQEVQGTYGGFRLSPCHVRDVLSTVDAVLPFHHERGGLVRNSCSEPAASSLSVRGRTYLADGVKARSGEATLALLAVDSFRSDPGGGGGDGAHCSAREGSYVRRMGEACEEAGIPPPFLFVVNFVLPWGHLAAYFYRPDGDGGGPFRAGAEAEDSLGGEGGGDLGRAPAERLWRRFVDGDDEYRNQRLKFIPTIVEGPWIVKKCVGGNPALIGQKLPTSYHRSVEGNYLEVCLDVTRGPQIGNTIATTVAGKSDLVTVDLAFLLEGLGEDELPEQVLAAYRLHHLDLKTAYTEAEWMEEVRRRQSARENRASI